jgi:hypothetical protein
MVQPIRLTPYVQGYPESVTSPVIAGRPVYHIVLIVLAIVCFLIFAAAGFGWITTAHPDGWLGLGGAFLAAAFI